MSEAVRVRFAPSPTGQPHIGNVRTALFNWLFARHHGGKFIVRVEDTDQDRLVPGAVDAVLDSLEWLHLDWDEGPRVGGPFAPYRQSERLENYQRLAEQLIQNGRAYRCYCTAERLKQMREEQQKQKKGSGYDRRCRDLDEDERRVRETEGGPSVIRFAMPFSGITRVHDIIHGDVEWQNELLDDFVLLKSDGFPTYHLAVVVDDHLMEISHVLRAEEWLPSTPRHLQIYDALGFDPPQFGHLPMILGPDRSKLSKRHGATALLEYRDGGFMPETIANFLLLLGWSMDPVKITATKIFKNIMEEPQSNTEIITPEAAIENFSLERVSQSAAIFDHDKLTWMNGVYIRQLSIEDLADRLLPFLERDLPAGALPVDRDHLLRIVPLIQQRTKLLSDVANMTAYFFQPEVEYDPLRLVQKGMDRESAVAALEAAREGLAKASQFEHQVMEELLRVLASDLGLSARQFFGTLRVAVTGRDATPPLFETMEVLGRERVLERVELAIERLGAV